MENNASKRNRFEKLVDYRIFIILIITTIVSIAINAFTMNYTFTKTEEMDKKLVSMNDEVTSSREANEKVLEKLNEIRSVQEKQNKALELAASKKRIQRIQNNNVMLLKSNGLDQYTDLKYCNNISVEEMDKIIDYYDSKVHNGTNFTGKGYVFCKAAEETGLNPVYIFAHAAVESGYGKSYYAVYRGNYFGINAVDTNPDLASYLGDSVDEGIVNGARWIKSNFYDNGYTTLKSMHDGGYATSSEWSNSIESVIQVCIEVM